MISAKPLISVIIPVYDRVRYVNSAVKSVLDLNGSEKIELLLITNIELPIEINRSNVKLIKTDISSLSGKLELGIMAASSDVLAFLEDDDLWCNDKIAKLVTVFGSSEEIDFYHNGNVLFRDDAVVNERKFVEGGDIVVDRRQLDEPTSNATIKKLMRNNIGFNMSSIAVRRRLLVDHLNILTSLSVYGIDSLSSIIALIFGKGIYVDKSVRTCVRVHRNNSFSSLIVDSSDFITEQIALKQSINCNFQPIQNYIELSLTTTFMISYSRTRRIERLKLFSYFVKYLKYMLIFGFLPEGYIVVTVLSRMLSMRFYLILLKVYHS